MNSDFAKKQAKAVKDFYETHSKSFSETRKSLWPEQILTAKEVAAGMTVVDVGAGNGRFAEALPDGAIYIGIEPALGLHEVAPPGIDLRRGELPHLKLNDDTADVTACFAVLHHIPTTGLRRASVEELIRITKPEGRIVATAWFISDATYEEVAGSLEDDVWIPWKADQKHSKRFVHRFTETEWKKLWTRPGLEIQKIGLFGRDDWTKDKAKARNFFVIAKKKSA